MEQLEDRNDEDYSEYLEVLEETTADPVLEDSAMSTSVVGDEQQQRIVVSVCESEPRNNQQQELDTYVQQIQSKYRKIMPKKIKIEQPLPIEIANSYSILKNSTFKADSLNKTTMGSTSIAPIIITNPSGMPLSQQPSTLSRGVKRKNTTAVDGIQDRSNFSVVGKTSIELFFNSMAQTVKLLPLKAQVEIKMAVCRIVTEAEVRHSKQNASMNTQRFITPPGMIPKLVLVPCSMIDNPTQR